MIFFATVAVLKVRKGAKKIKTPVSRLICDGVRAKK